ncbi:MAG: hypothetical protein WAM70_07410, partial [Pyrinomonadaceae bacterium]
MASRDYYFFVDESDFGATSPFPPLLAGFVAPMNPEVFEQAEKIMAGFPGWDRAEDPEFHATKLKPDPLNQGIQYLVPELQKLGWQPVRIVNLERVRYGERLPTQTNMVAELALRIFQAFSNGPDDRINLHLRADMVSLEPRNSQGHTLSISKRDYEIRFDEYLGLAAVRRGLARDKLNWEVPKISLKDAKFEPPLQICDLLANASHANYRRCSTRSKEILRDAFGSFDQTMETLDLVERVDRLMSEESYGVALQVLTDALHDEGQIVSQVRDGAGHRLQRCIERLEQIGVRGRDAQLGILVVWLDQLIGQQRLDTRGHKIANWLIDNLAAPLRAHLRQIDEDHTVNWFEYSLRRWALTAANHAGALKDAERQVHAMQELQPLLARQWERIPLLIDGMILQAVHQTDCFAFDRVSDNMEWIAEALKLQSSSIQRLMPAAFAQPIAYDARARALGTRVQALTLRGFNNEAEIEKARNVSDEAIMEFSSIDDQCRQYQYRCHLETIAGDFAEARRFLLMSMVKSDTLGTACEQENIGAPLLLIGNLELEDSNYRFWLQHWLRIGACSYLRHDLKEHRRFTEALRKFRMLNSAWCTGERKNWPAHGI